MTGDGLVGVLVMAHGTPERIEDLAAFYTEIRRGRPPSVEQVADLERRYRAIGGTSPLNEITRAQAAGITKALEAAGPGRFTVEVGTRFAAPRIEDGLAALAARDVTEVVGLVLAPHSSPVSVGEYERRARAAARGAGGRRHGPLPLRMVDHWWDAPGFAAMVAGRVRDSLDELVDDPAGDDGRATTVVFTAHSVPAALAAGGDDYPEQVRASAAAVAGAAALPRFTVAFQSAGRTDDEWLGPDVRDVVAGLAAAGTRTVVVCPIGFVSDHLEVLYDLDVELRAEAEQAGVAFARTASLNAAPELCTLLAGVVAAAAVPA
jgi:ferrochelatase